MLIWLLLQIDQARSPVVYALVKCLLIGFANLTIVQDRSIWWNETLFKLFDCLNTRTHRIS